MNELPVLDHKSFLFEWFLANCALDVLRWVDLLVSFLVAVEIAFAAEQFSTNPTNELLARPKIQVLLAFIAWNSGSESYFEG